MGPSSSMTGVHIKRGNLIQRHTHTQGEHHVKTAKDKGTTGSWETGLGHILPTLLILDLGLPEL